ncbi:TPA: phosphohydrolase [Candidatus Acetothermia bacterium]|nr:phosphohydrolase [Candidatus Acetothermia bacterium]
MKKNYKLAQVQERIQGSQRLRALWAASNVTAINRLHINDHGPTHVRIVMRLGLKLLRLLMAAGVSPGVVDHGLPPEEAEVVVALAAALHDIGHAVHREEHELLSLVLARPLVEELIAGLYDEPARTVILAETLHAIYAHRREAIPLTVEAGIIKVADALDMEKGRARIPFRVGEPTIHSVSALAIEKVEIKKGKEKPVLIFVRMSNSAGIFQLDNLLKEKLNRSGLKDYIEVAAEIEGEEKKIIERYSID